MTLRLTLLCQPATRATRCAAFADDEPPEHDGNGAVWQALRARVARPGRLVTAACSPARCARACAGWLGLDATIEPALGDWEVGRWRGRTVRELGETEPAALAAWLADADAAPHGGESLRMLLERVRCWLDRQAAAVSGEQVLSPHEKTPGSRRMLVVTHAAVIRAALVVALDAPPEAFWRIDIPPLTLTELHAAAHGWRLRRVGD